MRLPRFLSARLFIAFAVVLTASTALALFGSRALTESRALLAPALSAAKTGTLDTTAGGDANGNNVINPGDRLKYSVVITNNGTDAATGVNFSDAIDQNTTYTTGSIIASPVAVNESYSATGNVSITVPAASGVLVNDQNANTGAPCSTGNTCSITTTGSFSSAGGGNVILNADGSFTFNPKAGFEGADTFSYTLANGTGLTDTATVTINVSGMIWFVNNNSGACSANCDGRLSNPFTTLAAFNTANALSGGLNPDNNDNIFIYESATAYSGGVTLRAGQKLIGQDASASLQAITGLTPPTGSAPLPSMNTAAPATTITNSGGNGIALAVNGNTIRGLTVSATSGAGFSGVNVTSATVGSDVVVTGASGAALDLSGTIATNGTIAFGATVTNTSGRSISIQGRSGGTVDLSGAISDNGGSGILLNANTGATINFTSGINLSTGANAAFTATGGGTVNVTQNNTSIVNTLTTTTGTALNVANTTIGAGGLNFRSISANGAVNGIVLNNTGSGGGLTITGNGGVCTIATPTCSGGTIQNTTGGDDSSVTPVGAGIVLNNASNISLTRVWIHDHSNYGIRGTNVNGFTLDNSVVNAINGVTPYNGTNASSPFNDSSVYFSNGSGIGLQGTVSITNTHISGGYANEFRVSNTSGTLNAIFSSVNIGRNTSPNHNDAIQVEGIGSSTTNLTVQNSTFTSTAGDQVQWIADGSGGGKLVLNGNAFTNNHPAIATGGGMVTLNAGASGSATSSMDIKNNTIRDGLTNAFTIVKSNGGTGTVNVLVNNNQIGVSGVANSGSKEGSGVSVFQAGGGTLNLAITNNQIRQYNNYGIVVQGGAGIAVSGIINSTITGNTLAEPGTNAAVGNPFQGVVLNNGVTPNDNLQTCWDVKANSPVGSGRNGGHDLRVRSRQSGSVRVPGYNGTVTDTTAIASFIANQNDANANDPAANAPVPSSSAVKDASASFSGGAVCTQPSIPLVALAEENVTNSDNNSGNSLSFLNPNYQLRYQIGANIQSFVETSVKEETIPNKETASLKTPGKADVTIKTNRKAVTQNTSFTSSISAFMSDALSSILGAVNTVESLIVPRAFAQSNKEFLASAAGETITKSLGTIPAGESVTIQFTATINTTPANFYSVSNTANITADGGISINSTTATNTVVQPASIAKAFGTSFTAVNGTTSLTYTITNGNSASLSGLSFTDSLPSGLVINTPNGLTNSCGGTVTATQDTSVISLSGGAIGANTTCTVKIDVKGTTEGAKTSATGAVSSTNGGSGNTATATLNVIAAPTFTKAFGSPTIQLNGSTSLSFTITNASTVFPINNVSFTDALPAGLVVSNPNALSGVCGGGAITANQGSGTVSLSGAVLASNTNCTFSVNVTGTTAGLKNNSAMLSTTELGTGATATASVTVIAAPTIGKAFNPTSITAGNSSVVTLTLSNGNTTGALTNASFSDMLSNMTAVGGAAGGTCAGASSNTFAAGATNLSFSGITIPNNGSCTVTFSVTSSTVGTNPNTTTGITTNQTPVAGSASNTADLTVIAAADLTLTKTHTGNFTQGDIGKTYTITATNSGGTATSGTVTVTDTLPSGLTATAISGMDWNCILGTLTCTRTDALAASGSYPAITLTVDVASNAPASVTNTATVSGGGETDTSNNTANDPTTISSAATYTISGQITNGGAALEGVSVALSGTSSSSTATDAAGNYSFTNLSGGGNFTVTPSLNGYTFNPVNTPVNNLTANQTAVDFATSVVAYEGDAAPRPSGDGDGTINGGDLTVIRRFVAGIETPASAATGSEFQRVDSAPLYDANNLLVKGDGEINGGDITQVRLYAAGLSAVQPAGGPAAPVVAPPPVNNPISAEGSSSLLAPNLIAATRDVRPVKVSLVGNVLTVAVNLNTDASLAGANTVGFTLLYDTAVLSSPTNIRSGADAPAAATLTPNTSQSGKVGIVLDLPVTGATTTFPLGDAQLVLIDFTVAANPPASTTLNFGDTPVVRFVGDTNGNRLTTTFSAAPVSILGPTAAAVTVGGRVISQSGRGINNVTVSMTDARGNITMARSNAFGYYRFTEVTAGETYILTAKAKRYTFSQPSQLVNVNEDTFDINFIGESGKSKN